MPMYVLPFVSMSRPSTQLNKSCVAYIFSDNQTKAAETVPTMKPGSVKSYRFILII